jgi:hypothetical protein
VDRSPGRSPLRIAGCGALLAAVASFVSGCPAPGYDPDWRSKAERVLVLPLNLVAAMPEELAGGARRVDKILLDHLSERGKSVSTIGFKDAQAAWHAGESACRSEQTKGCDRFAGVAPFAARHLRANHDYDVLIVPYLLLRGARTNGYVASFDGVERSVKMPGYAPYGPYGYGPYGWGGSPGWGGSRIRAASLKVFGFSADGKKLFDGIGGLDVVDQIESSDESGATVEVRENVLGNPEAIREGVALALKRLLPLQ